jgi:ribonuclease P/MRP protein subunit POP7
MSNLTFEKKNTHLLHIPSQPSQNDNKRYRIEKRPIPRAPVASPYAGSHVPKIVYVSSKTPFMSAVKRVQKLLSVAERRAMTPLIGKRRQSHWQHGGGRAGKGHVLEKCQQKLREDKVLVKATGRAIEKALSVGRWFEEGRGGGGEEFEVVVRTGSVCVVDDIVEEDASTHEEHEEEREEGERSVDPDITMNMTNTTDNTTNSTTTDIQDKDAEKEESERKEESKNQRRRRRKRERVREQRLKAFVDEDGETPESRTRWVNMVEIAINMK